MFEPAFFSPVIGIIHDVEHQRWHPVLFVEAPLPGPPSPDKPVRHKSKMHHTDGFLSREEAVENAKTDLGPKVKEYAIGEVRFALEGDFPWDGNGIPAISTIFASTPDGLIPVF